MMEEGSEEDCKSEELKLEFEPSDHTLPFLVDFTILVSAIRAIRSATDARIKRNEIKKILTAIDWNVLYTDKKTGRKVMAEFCRIEHDHEYRTAIKLAQMNYDVIFVPNGMFKRGQKRFDIYLLRDTIILEADMKAISSDNPDTIAKRIIDGSNQTSRVILDILSAISKMDLIDGLRSGTGRNNLIKEVLLFYRNKFYVLPVSLSWSKRIFEIIKNEKGYT